MEDNTKAIALGLHEGLEWLDANEPSKAVSAFQKVLQLNPSCGDAYSGIGHAFLQMEEFNGAKAAFSKSVQFKPTAARYVLLGGTLRKLNMRKDAFRAFRKALELLPDNREALLNVADMAQERHPKFAITILRKVLGAAPDFVECYLELGALLNRQGEFRDAEKLLQKARQLDPSNLWVWIELGNSLWRLGKTCEAEEVFIAAARKFLDAPEPLWSLASYVERTGRVREAENLFKQAVQRKPSDVIAQNALTAFLERNHLEEENRGQS